MTTRRVLVGRAAAYAVAVALVALTVPVTMARPAFAARVKTIGISDASIVEGDSGQQNLAFSVTWVGSKGGAAPSVHYATSNITASAGTDYTAASGSANLTNGGCRCATITVPIKGDTTTEGTETFQIDLSNPVNATVGDAQAIGTIYDNEGPPSLIVSDTSASEAAGGLTFTVQLTNPSASAVTVSYATADGSAVDGVDYSGTDGTLSFAAGETFTSISIAVNDDLLAEEDETFRLDLSNSSNAAIVDPEGVGSILNDDADPVATVADVSVYEGDVGTASATFTVSLNVPSGRETAFDFATSPGTAEAGVDLVSTNGTVTIPAGAVSATFDVGVIGDTLHEGDESFGVDLSGEVDLTLGTTAVVGSITDDDPVPTLGAQTTTAAESDTSVTVTVSLSNPTTSAVSANWITADSAATAGTDYSASNGSLSIPPGQTSAAISVPLLDDTTDEPDEAFAILLFDPVNALSESSLTVIVTDDDPTPTVLTAKVLRRRTAVKARGVLEPTVPGLDVTVELLKKKGSNFVLVAKELVPVKAPKDRDGDGMTDGKYLASFTRPARGTYRFKVVFSGTEALAATSTTVTFRL